MKTPQKLRAVSGSAFAVASSQADLTGAPCAAMGPTAAEPVPAPERLLLRVQMKSITGE